MQAEATADATEASDWEPGVIGWAWNGKASRPCGIQQGDTQGQKVERWTLCADFTARRRDARHVLNEAKERLAKLQGDGDTFKMHSWVEFSTTKKSKVWIGEPFTEVEPKGQQATSQDINSYYQRACGYRALEAKHQLRQQAELTMKLLSQSSGGAKAGNVEAVRLMEEQHNKVSAPPTAHESAIITEQREQIERLQQEIEQLRSSNELAPSISSPSEASEEALEAAFNRGIQHGIQQERARMAAVRQAAAALKPRIDLLPSQSAQGSHPNASEPGGSSLSLRADSTGATFAAAAAIEISSDEDDEEERRSALARKEERRARKLEKRARKAARAKAREDAEVAVLEKADAAFHEKSKVREGKKRARDDVDSDDQLRAVSRFSELEHDLGAGEARGDDVASKLEKYRDFKRFVEFEKAHQARKKQKQEALAKSASLGSDGESEHDAPSCRQRHGTSTSNLASSSRQPGVGSNSQRQVGSGGRGGRANAWTAAEIAALHKAFRAVEHIENYWSRRAALQAKFNKIAGKNRSEGGLFQKARWEGLFPAQNKAAD